MKRFLGQIVLGLGLLIGWVVVNDAFLQPMVIQQSLEGMGQIETVILGDSHGERIWLDNCINLSRGGDPPFVQLATLRSVLPHLPKLRHVVVGIGPQNLSALPDKRIRDNHTRFLSGNSARLANVLSLNSSAPSIRFRAHQFTGEIQWPVGIPFFQTPPEFDSSSDLSVERTQKRLSRHEVTADNWFVESNSSTEAFSSLAALPEKKEALQIWFIGTPLHSSYREHVGFSGWQRYKTILNHLSEKRQVNYISLEEEVLPDSMFFDADHINANGMTWLNDSLSRMIATSNGTVN